MGTPVFPSALQTQSERDLLIGKVLSESIHQALHPINGVSDILSGDLGVVRYWGAFDEVEGRDALTDRYDSSAESEETASSSNAETMDAAKRSAVCQQEGLQELLHGLLEAKSRKFRVLLPSPVGSAPVLLGDVHPIRRRMRLLMTHKGSHPD